MKSQLCPASFSCLRWLLAQSRFDGTREMKIDTIRFSNRPEEHRLRVYHCLTCVP